MVITFSHPSIRDYFITIKLVPLAACSVMVLCFTSQNRYGFKSLERRSYRHNTARKKGRRLQGPGPFLPAASIIKQGVKQQVHISAFSSGNMGLRTVDRPPTPNLFGHLPMSLVKVLSDPSADVQQFARQTTFPSHGPTSFPVCSFNGKLLFYIPISFQLFSVI